MAFKAVTTGNTHNLSFPSAFEGYPDEGYMVLEACFGISCSLFMLQNSAPGKWGTRESETGECELFCCRVAQLG